jgi:folate-binding protein YgfZ
MAVPALRVASRPRDFVRVSGPDAARHLQAMVSNDVEALCPGEACEALLLTAKARVIAPLVVLRRSADDYLLLTEPGLGERVRATLLRARFALKCEIEPEEHTSVVVLGEAEGIPTADYGLPAVEVLDSHLEPTVSQDELELLRIRAGTPRFGREIDERVLPAEAGLEERAIDFAKGCYPGQEPIARQHYRGRVNRTLRVLELEGSDLPAYDAELTYDGKVVGRITSAARDGDMVVALAYVRVEVPSDATLDLGGRRVVQAPAPSYRTGARGAASRLGGRQEMRLA